MMMMMIPVQEILSRSYIIMYSYEASFMTTINVLGWVIIQES